MSEEKSLRSVNDSDLLARLVDLRTKGLLTKGIVGLENADNTSDINKPVSTAQQNALDAKLDATEKGAASGVAALDSSGKLPSSSLPDISLTNLDDVLISTPTDQQALVYNSSTGKWANATVPSSGGGGGVITTVGSGDATQNATIQGAQAASGTNVVPGDLTIQPPGGTGSMGSGAIKFNVAAPSPPVSCPVHSVSGWTASTSLNASSTFNVYLPPASQYPDISLFALIFINSTTVTLTNVSVGGVAFTAPTHTVNATAGGTIAMARLANANSLARGTVHAVAGTLSAAAIFIGAVFVLDSAVAVPLIQTQTFSNTTSASCTLTGLAEKDVVFDCVVYGKSTTAVMPDTPTTPVSKRVNRTFSSYQYSGASPYTYFSMSSSYAPTGGSVTYARTFSSSTSGTYFAIAFSTNRPASSSTPTFNTALTISPYGITQYPIARPTAPSETTIYTFTSTNLIRFLGPTSPRLQLVDLPSNPPSIQYRTLVLPRADFLPLGTTFVIKQVASFGYITLSVALHNRSATAYLVSGNNWRSDPFPSSCTSDSIDSRNVFLQLIDNNTPEGIWTIQYNQTTSNVTAE